MEHEDDMSKVLGSNCMTLLSILLSYLELLVEAVLDWAAIVQRMNSKEFFSEYIL